MIFNPPSQISFKFKYIIVEAIPEIISTMNAKRLIKQEVRGILANVMTLEKKRCRYLWYVQETK